MSLVNASPCLPTYETPGVEALLFELSARFINLPSEQVDHEIENALGRICACLEFDRSTLWEQPTDEPSTLLLTHVHQLPGAPPPPSVAHASRLFPWVLRQLSRGETLAIARMDDLPPEAATDKQTWQAYGTQSTLVIPLSTGGVSFGALSFALLRQQMDWPPTLVKRLELFAQVIANAKARARSDRTLRQTAARLRLVADAAGIGLWIVTLDTGKVWATAQTRELFGFAPHVDLTYDRFVEAIHPDDREMVRKAVHQAAETRAELRAEYRVVLRDGSCRWIASRGNSQASAPGEREALMGVSIDVTERKRTEEQLRRTLDEVQLLRDQLHHENVYLRGEVEGLYGQGRLVGHSRSLKQVLAQAEQVAPTDSTVLLLGETGTGKELIASVIHDSSPRRGKTMVRVNCAAIPASLLESELFGREKGAYTGALSRQIGRFEMAHGSTLFLDEIGDLPSEVQAKLLRVLQEHQIERLGSSRTIHIDVRIITATNRDLEKAVREGKFREDLYYRLNVFPVLLPPLRSRREDIPVLVSAFVEEFATRFGKTIESIPRESMAALQRYHWPGNVRELRNVIERAMIVTKGPRLWIDPPGGSPSSTQSLAMRQAETQHIRQVLEMTGWRIRGRNGAAEILGLKPTTLESRMTRLGIHRPEKSPTK